MVIFSFGTPDCPPFGRASFDPYRTTRDPSQRDVSMANIKMSVSIDAPPERVFPLAATPQGLARWWAADATECDGLVDLGFFKRATVYRLQPVRSVAPSAAEWRCLGEGEWTGTRLVFELPRLTAQWLPAYAPGMHEGLLWPPSGSYAISLPGRSLARTASQQRF